MRKKFITTEKFISQKRELLALLLRVGIPLMKNVFTTLVKNFLLPLGINSSNVGNRCCDLGSRMTLITSNEEMNDIMEIVQSLQESDLVIKRVSETIKNKIKEQKVWISYYVIRCIRC